MKLIIKLENKLHSERVERVKGRLEGDLLKFHLKDRTFSLPNILQGPVLGSGKQPALYFFFFFN